MLNSKRCLSVSLPKARMTRLPPPAPLEPYWLFLVWCKIWLQCLGLKVMWEIYWRMGDVPKIKKGTAKNYLFTRYFRNKSYQVPDVHFGEVMSRAVIKQSLLLWHKKVLWTAEIWFICHLRFLLLFVVVVKLNAENVIKKGGRTEENGGRGGEEDC